MLPIDDTKAIQSLFGVYISECEYTKRLRSETIKSYKEVFNTFQKIMPEIITPSDIAIDTLNILYKRLSTRKRLIGKELVQRELKSSTIKTYYSKLIAFFRWLERYGHIENPICHKITKPQEPKYTDEKALTEQDIGKLVSTIALHTMNDILAYQRDMLILSFGIYSGLRRRELLSLKISDIDFRSKTVFVNGKTSKSKKDRYVPLHPQLLHQLDSHFKERKLRKLKCEYIIISTRKDAPLSVYGLKHWVEKYTSLSGVKFHMHQTRHTFACALAKSGADITTIMKALGHSTIQMTQRYLRSITAEHSRDYISNISY